MSRVTAQCPYEYAHPGKCKPCCSTVAEQLFIMGPNYCLFGPSHLDCACLSLVASLSALPSSLLGADLYLHHPALLGPNHLSSVANAPHWCISCIKSLQKVGEVLAWQYIFEWLAASFTAVILPFVASKAPAMLETAPGCVSVLGFLASPRS